MNNIKVSSFFFYARVRSEASLKGLYIESAERRALREVKGKTGWIHDAYGRLASHYIHVFLKV